MKLFTKQVDTIPLLLLIIAPSVRLMIPAANALVLYIIMPGLFVWVLNKYKGGLRKDCLKYYLWFLIWLTVTVITSTDTANSFSNMKSLAAGLLSSVVMFKLANAKLYNGIYIALSYILLFITTIWYLWSSGELIGIDTDSGRLNDTLVNANDLAYYLFYVACSFTVLFFFTHFGKLARILIYVALVVISLWISLITASRQILIVVIPYIILCLFFQFFTNKRLNIQRILPIVIIGLVALYFLLPAVKNMFAGSYMETRMEMEIEDDSRTKVLEDAIRVGFQHPILGVGPGNLTKFSRDGSFAHNSYAELFSTSGVPAVIIYLMMIFPIVKVNRRRFKETKKPIFSFLFLTCVLWLLYNILYVFYSNLWLISFYYLLMGISDNYYYSLKYKEQSVVGA